jgi:hypothetical protein
MSVKICNRADCTHIMCDRMICGSRFYICNDCFDELIICKSTWVDVHPNQVQRLIEEFLDTTPGTYVNPNVNLQDLVDREFDLLTRWHD